jgi:hypothetical protein
MSFKTNQNKMTALFSGDEFHPSNEDKLFLTVNKTNKKTHESRHE